MATAPDFQYVKPATLDAALELMRIHGTCAKPLAGGTDLAVHLKEGVITPAWVVDLKGIAELRRCEEKDGRLFLGALITFADILALAVVKERLPVLADAAASVASVAIRQRATLVGNIVSAVPSLDAAGALLVYDAVVHTQSTAGRREIPVDSWFLAPRQTALTPDEIVLGVSLKLPAAREGGCYLKLSRYAGEDLAQAGLSVVVTADNHYRIAHTALAPAPRRARSVEALLNGKHPDTPLLDAAKQLLLQEISPISDLRATKRYREHMVQVMLERGLKAARGRLLGEKIDIARILGG